MVIKSHNLLNVKTRLISFIFICLFFVNSSCNKEFITGSYSTKEPFQTMGMKVERFEFIKGQKFKYENGIEYCTSFSNGYYTIESNKLHLQSTENINSVKVKINELENIEIDNDSIIVNIGLLCDSIICSLDYCYSLNVDTHSVKLTSNIINKVKVSRDFKSLRIKLELRNWDGVPCINRVFYTELIKNNNKNYSLSLNFDSHLFVYKTIDSLILIKNKRKLISLDGSKKYYKITKLRLFLWRIRPPLPQALVNRAGYRKRPVCG